MSLSKNLSQLLFLMMNDKHINCNNSILLSRDMIRRRCEERKLTLKQKGKIEHSLCSSFENVGPTIAHHRSTQSVGEGEFIHVDVDLQISRSSSRCVGENHSILQLGLRDALVECFLIDTNAISKLKKGCQGTNDSGKKAFSWTRLAPAALSEALWILREP